MHTVAGSFKRLQTEVLFR